MSDHTVGNAGDSGDQRETRETRRDRSERADRGDHAERLRRDLARCSAELRSLNEVFNQRVVDPGMPGSNIERLQRQIERLTQRQSRLVTELLIAASSPSTSSRSSSSSSVRNREDALLAPSEPTAPEEPSESTVLRFTDSGDGASSSATVAVRHRSRPMRETVLDTLAELEVVAAPRAVSDIAEALYGEAIPVERFASLRRDEERAYINNPLRRPVWIVPAINCVGLAAIPRLVALSSWPAEERLVGSRTMRTAHLRTLLRLLNFRGRAAGESHDLRSARFDHLILQYARSVPDAFDWGGTPYREPDGEPDWERVAAAVEVELAQIEPADRVEREAAAHRLGKLSDRYQFWGAPVVAEGGQIERRNTP